MRRCAVFLRMFACIIPCSVPLLSFLFVRSTRVYSRNTLAFVLVQESLMFPTFKARNPNRSRHGPPHKIYIFGIELEESFTRVIITKELEVHQVSSSCLFSRSPIVCDFVLRGVNPTNLSKIAAHRSHLCYALLEGCLRVESGSQLQAW